MHSRLVLRGYRQHALGARYLFVQMHARLGVFYLRALSWLPLGERAGWLRSANVITHTCPCVCLYIYILSHMHILYRIKSRDTIKLGCWRPPECNYFIFIHSTHTLCRCLVGLWWWCAIFQRQHIHQVIVDWLPSTTSFQYACALRLGGYNTPFCSAGDSNDLYQMAKQPLHILKQYF